MTESYGDSIADSIAAESSGAKTYEDEIGVWPLVDALIENQDLQVAPIGTPDPNTQWIDVPGVTAVVITPQYSQFKLENGNTITLPGPGWYEYQGQAVNINEVDKFGYKKWMLYMCLGCGKEVVALRNALPPVGYSLTFYEERSDSEKRVVFFHSLDCIASWVGRRMTEEKIANHNRIKEDAPKEILD